MTTERNATGSTKDGACWRAAVVHVMRLTGIRLPQDFAQALAAADALADEVPPGLACRAGDLIQTRGATPDDVEHVAVATGPFRALHLAADGSTAEVSINALQRAGLIIRVMRPRAGAGGRS